LSALFATAASAQVTLDLSTATAQTHGVVTLNFTVNPSGSVSVLASASNANVNVAELNRTLTGSVSPGLSGSFSMRLRAINGDGNTRTSIDGMGVQGQNAQRIDWGTTAGQLSEILVAEVDLSTAVGINGISFLGFRKTNSTSTARIGVVDFNGGVPVERASGSATETILFSNGPTGNFSLGGNGSGSLSFSQLDQNGGGCSIGALTFDIAASELIEFTADTPDITGTQNVTLSWTVPNPPVNGSYQIESNKTTFNGGLPLNVTGLTVGGVGSVTVSLAGTQTLTFVENTPASASPLVITSRTGPGFPNITRTAGTVVAQWLTSTAHSDRNLLAGFHRGYLWIQSRPDDGSRNLVMVYDISKPATPVEVHRRDLPSGGVRPEHVYFMYEGDKFLMPVESGKFHDMTNMLDIRMIDDAPFTLNRNGDAAAEYVQLPLQFNGQYGYATSATPLAIWNTLTNTRLSNSIDPQVSFGFKGTPLVIGNLLIAVGSRNAPGIATYDISDPSNPVLLDVITTELDALDPGGFVNEGAYEPALWGNYVVYGNQDRNKPQIKVVDFSDPTNLRLVAHITDPSLMSARYVQFQDEYLFTGNAKIDMRTFTKVRNLKPTNSSNQISEYTLPMGNLVAVGEHQGTNGGKAYLIAHQSAPDTRPPFVNYHNPPANATDRHVLSRIGVVIPETLNTLTIDGASLIVRPFGGDPIRGTISYTDKDILSFVPEQPLQDNTTYEVILPAGGIKDIVGNAIEEFGFAFSTGPTLAPSPFTGIRLTYGNGGQPGTGNPWQFLNPGTLRLEAENFNQGGQGGGYHDSDTGNLGGAYRPGEGVDLSPTSDAGGGFVVDGTVAGEWLQYSVSVAAAGFYDLRLRVANDATAATNLRVLFGPLGGVLVDVTGLVSVPAGGGFSTLAVGNLPLSAGPQVMRVLFEGGGARLNWVEIEGMETLSPPLLHYNLDGDLLDRSPSGFDGVPVNFPAAPFTADAVVGTGALDFDGVDDFVAIKDMSLAGATLPAASVSCWIRTTDGSPQVIASFDRNEYWQLSVAGDGVAAGRIGWHVLTSVGQQDFGSVRTVNDGAWHHVVTVFDGAAGQMRIYIDGSLDATRPNAGTVFGTGAPRFGFLGVGSEAAVFNGNRGPLDFYQGSLDDFQIFDKALTQRQVEALFLQRNSSGSPPVVTGVDVSDYPASTTSATTITVTAVDPDNGPLEYRLNAGDGSGFTAWQSSPVFQHTFGSDGHFGISVQVRDLSGVQTIETGLVTVLDSPPTGPFPTRSSPIAEVGANRVLVVNPDNDSVTSIHTDSLVKEFEVPVGADPRSIAVAATGEVWVTCIDGDRLDVLSPANGALLASVQLDYGSQPYGIAFSPDGLTGFVSLQGSGKLLRINPSSRSVTGTLALGPEPRAIAITSDGGRVLVTRFTSPQAHGEVYDVNAASLTLTRVIHLAKDATPDESNNSRGVPNYLMGITITPDGTGAWVSSQKTNTDRGLFLNGQALSHENTVRAILSYIDLTTAGEDITKRIDIDNSNLPTGIAISPLGDFAFVALQANNLVQDFDLLGASVGTRWGTGAAPTGVWYVAGNDRLVVKNDMDRSVTVFDAANFVRRGKGLVNLAKIPTVAKERLLAQVLRGKQIFHDAADPRMALDGYQSCASCHQDGGTDNRVWDFTDRGEGLRNTTDLRARRGTGHGFVHWSANFDEIQDFEHDIRNAFLGEGFLSDAEFNTGTRNTTLGHPKAGINADLDALAAYVSSLDSVGRSPHRSPDGDLTAEARAGRELFVQLNCTSCHASDTFTDSNRLPALHNVGTLGAGSGARLGGGPGSLAGLDTPTLRGLWSTAPYLHDGSAATLAEVLTTRNPLNLHGATSALTTTQIDNLVAYLLQIDDSEASANPEVNHGFVLRDNFEGYAVGSNLQGQGGWNSALPTITAAAIASDPEVGANRVLSLAEITANGNQAVIDNTFLQIEDGTTATVFFRMRHTGLSGDPDTPMGVTSNDVASQGNPMDLQVKVRGSGGSSVQMKTEGGDRQVLDLDRNVWFNVWWVISNGAGGGPETLEWHLQSDDDPDYQTIRHVTTVTKNPGNPNPLIDTLAFMKFNENGRLLIDDIYYDDDRANLNDPTGGFSRESGIASASTVSSHKIGLDWALEPGAGIYYVELATSPDGPWTPWKRLLGNPSGIVVDGLDPVTSFAFRVTTLTTGGELLSRDIVEGVTQEPYDDWAQAIPLPAEVYDKMKDPDGDGILNGFERAYGSHPLFADHDVKPYQVQKDGKWFLNYRYNAAAADDLTLVPQLSNNLVEWKEGVSFIDDKLIETEGTVETRAAELLGPAPPSLFMRVRLESKY
jgi:mono/diheme cytochrome c family protein